MTVEQGIAVAKDMIRKMIDQCYLEEYTVQDLKILCTYCDTALDMSFDHNKYTFNRSIVYSQNDYTSVYLYYRLYGGWTGHCIDATEDRFIFRYERGDRAIKLMRREIAPIEPNEYFVDHLVWIVLETRMVDKPLKISFASWPIEYEYKDKTMMPMIRVLKFALMYCIYLIGTNAIKIIDDDTSVDFDDDQMRLIFEKGVNVYMERPMRSYFNENGWDNDTNLKKMYKIDPEYKKIITDIKDERYDNIMNYIKNKKLEQARAKHGQEEISPRIKPVPVNLNGPKAAVITLNADDSNNMSQVSKLLSEVLGIDIGHEQHYSLIGGGEEGNTNNSTTASNGLRRPDWSIVDKMTSNNNPDAEMLDRIRDTVFGIVGVIKNSVRIDWKEYRLIHDAICKYIDSPYDEKELNTIYGSEFIDNHGLILSMSIVANKNDATNYALYHDDPGYHLVRVKGPIARTFINKFSNNQEDKYPEFIICDIAGGSNFSLGDPRLVKLSREASEEKVHADGLLLIATAFAVIYSEKMNQIRLLTPNLIINENTFGKLLNFCETGGIFTSKTMITRTLTLMDDIINDDITSYKNNTKYSIGEFIVYLETPFHDFIWDHEKLEWLVDPRGGDESLFGYGNGFALYRDYFKAQSDSPYYSSYGVYRDLKKILQYMLTTTTEGED